MGNGFLKVQWDRLTREAQSRGYTETMPYVRAIIEEYFAMEDAQQAAEDEDDLDVVHLVTPQPIRRSS